MGDSKRGHTHCAKARDSRPRSPPPVAKTLGPQGTAAFLTKGAGLITQLDQSILRRVADLSF